MIKRHYYRIADFVIGLCAPGQLDMDRLLPSFRPFRCEEGDGDGVLLHFGIGIPVCPTGGETDLVEEAANDFGYVRLLQAWEGYRLEMRSTVDGAVHYAQATPRFTFVAASLCWDDPLVGNVLCSMLRFAFSQAVLDHGGVSLHAAAVVLKGNAYLFMGKSGTGKSTHARLWLRCFSGCRLLNDDNPVVRIRDGRAIVYGTPWSGKTPCYRNESFPVGGIVRLVQAGGNRFVPQREDNAFIALLPGCMAIRKDAGLHGELCGSLVSLAESVPVGVLECRPDEEAARMCAAAFLAGKNKKILT